MKEPLLEGCVQVPLVGEDGNGNVCNEDPTLFRRFVSNARVNISNAKVDWPCAFVSTMIG